MSSLCFGIKWKTQLRGKGSRGSWHLVWMWPARAYLAGCEHSRNLKGSWEDFLLSLVKSRVTCTISAALLLLEAREQLHFAAGLWLCWAGTGSTGRFSVVATLSPLLWRGRDWPSAHRWCGGCHHKGLPCRVLLPNSPAPLSCIIRCYCSFHYVLL